VGARAIQVTSSEDQANAVYKATWMLLDRPAGPGGVAGDTAAADFLPPGSAAQSEERIVRTWTDDYSNLLAILK
jgi:hypothetical protein